MTDRTYLTNTEATDAALGDGDRRCLWQICPKELPADMGAMSFEMWLTNERLHERDNGLRLVQLIVDRKHRDADDWFRYVESFQAFTPSQFVPTEVAR